MYTEDMKHMRNKSSKEKSAVWFIRVRGSYLPVNIAGSLTYLPFLGYLVVSCVLAFHETDSWMLALLFIVPNWVAAAVVMTYIAARKS